MSMRGVLCFPLCGVVALSVSATEDIMCGGHDAMVVALRSLSLGSPCHVAFLRFIFFCFLRLLRRRVFFLAASDVLRLKIVPVLT